jgi:hypothetical protein
MNKSITKFSELSSLDIIELLNQCYVANKKHDRINILLKVIFSYAKQKDLTWEDESVIYYVAKIINLNESKNHKE